LFYGETHLLFAQVVSTIVAYALAIVGTIILYKIVSAFMKVRADKNEEIAGLDITEHDERAYNQAVMSTGSPFESISDSPLAAPVSTISDMGTNSHNL
jgi:Amt family ammonium transporter